MTSRLYGGKRNGWRPELWFVWLLWTAGLGMTLTRYAVSGWCVLILAVVLAGCGVAVSEKGVNMFGRKAAPVTGSGTPALPDEPVAQVQDEPTRTGAVARSCTLLAAGTQITGDVVITGDCQVCGHIIGTVILSDGVLRVMNGGRIDGDVRSPSVTIDGSIHGTCEADMVEILENGHLDGLCRSRQFSIASGGIFTGHSERRTGPAVAETDKEAEKCQSGTVTDLPSRRAWHVPTSGEDIQEEEVAGG